jgi:hypothetical protein
MMSSPFPNRTEGPLTDAIQKAFLICFRKKTPE